MKFLVEAIGGVMSLLSEYVSQDTSSDESVKWGDWGDYRDYHDYTDSYLADEPDDSDA